MSDYELRIRLLSSLRGVRARMDRAAAMLRRAAQSEPNKAAA